MFTVIWFFCVGFGLFSILCGSEIGRKLTHWFTRSWPTASTILWRFIGRLHDPANVRHQHVYFEYICWKFAGRLLDRVNTPLLAESPKKTTAELQRVLNAAARVVSNCGGKYDRGLTHFRRHVLHWLDVTDRIRVRLRIQVYKCRHSMAPGYLIDFCQPVASIDGHGHLQSASRGQLQVPRIKMTTYGNRAFGHVGLSTWNAMPNTLKCSTHYRFTYFWTSSKTFLLLL